MKEKVPPDPQLPDQPNLFTRLLRRFQSQAHGDVIAAQVGEEARNVVVGKNVIQIGSLVIPFYLAVMLAVGVAVIAISTVTIALNASGLTRFWATPVRMTGQFNIAVANFGAMSADGEVESAEDGRLLSKWVFDALKQAYAQNPALAGLGTVEIWHDSPGIPGKNVDLGLITGDTPQARETAAGTLADKIGAHMVIYGTIRQAGSSPGLALEFFISPQLRAETSAIIGRHTLGGPIPVPLSFDANNPLSSVLVGADLRIRSAALFQLTIGLTYDLLGQAEQALAIFRQAEQQLEDWQASDGKEILYFFIGREALFLEEIDEAEAAFRRALAINPAYARAQIGLGSVAFFRAQAAAAQSPIAPDAVDPVLAAYEQALSLAQTAPDRLIASIAQLALGATLRLQGQSYYQLGDFVTADRTLSKAAIDLTETLDPLAQSNQHRLLAQAYQSLGATHFIQADLARRQGDATGERAYFEQAQAAYTQCVEQGGQAPFDEILRSRIIAAAPDGCRPKLEEVNRNLQQPTGG